MYFCIILMILNLLYSNSFAFEEEKCMPLAEKVCVDFSEKTIDGFAVSKCWKYEQKFKCISKEQNSCSVFEDNRGCNEISGICIEDTDLGICKHFEKKFVCGAKLEEKDETLLIDSQFTVIKDEKDLSSCSEQEINKYCQIAEETCIEGAETRNIKGKEVTKDCWKWDRQYICSSNTFIDECQELKDSCQEISKECLYERDGRCEHYEIQYKCSEEQSRNVDCIATKFCIAGICETKKRNRHNDFGYAVSHLNILTQMKNNEPEGCKCPNGKKDCRASEIDPKSCKFFNGNSNRCRKHTGQFNCCSGKGFLRGVFGCSQEEKDLVEKRKAGLCHYVGTWRGEKFEFYKKWQSYCCFKNRLARIIQVNGRNQLGISWGDKEYPNCRALTLEEIQQINFSKIDFSEVFDEVKGKAIANSKQGEIKKKVESLNANQMSEVINKKISKFYKGDK